MYVHDSWHECASLSVCQHITKIQTRLVFTVFKEVICLQVLDLVEKCAVFYHNLSLVANCMDFAKEHHCHSVPTECKKDSAIYNLLHYITDSRFMRGTPEGAGSHLTYAMTLLPIAASSAAQPLYWQIISNGLPQENDVKVIAMNFGIKHNLFDHYLAADILWFLIAVSIIFIFMWLYTTSLFITTMAIINVIITLEVAYFLYTYVLGIKFFPFMNILAVVIVIGLGFDDVVIYCKVWSLSKQEKNIGTLEKIISDSLRHAFLSMLVTSFTTAAAFYANLVSNITALRCFAIFAGTAVLVNFLLIVTWIPASMVIYEKWCSDCLPCFTPNIYTAKKNKCHYLLSVPYRIYDMISEWARIFFEKILPCIVIRLRYLWLLMFGGLAIIGMVLVFYSPRLKLPSANDFQVFSISHPFEIYDFRIKDEFWFEKAAGASIATMPLTVVWGIHPTDKGNKMDPFSESVLEYDSAFNIASPDAQLWLLNFCRKLRSTSMYQSSSGPQITNCFIENFRRFMRRGCEGLTGEDHQPCCKSSTFPFEETVFRECINVYQSIVSQSNALIFTNTRAGLRYSKDTGNIVALIVDFNSKEPFSFNYEAMNKFFSSMDRWTNQHLSGAPLGIRHGWFISYLDFYDLQHTIAHDTPVAIGVSIAIATAVAFLTTLNFLLTIFAIFSIIGTIFSTIGILVLLGWELNVLESVTITVAVGMSIDFTLHYGMAYRLAPDFEREMRVICSISRMGSPVAMAAFTTFLAGAIIMPSTVLAYRQLGTFLMILMSMSWAYSTFFFQGLLRTFGPSGGFGQLLCPTSEICTSHERQHVDKTAYAMSESTLSSSGIYHPTSSEIHELEPLTEREQHLRVPLNHRGGRYHHRLSNESTSSNSDVTANTTRDVENIPSQSSKSKENQSRSCTQQKDTRCNPDSNVNHKADSFETPKITL